MNDYAGISDESQDLIDTQDLLYTDEDKDAFKQYNKSINKHNPMYTRLEPKRGTLLLRLFTKELQETDGLLRPNRVKVKIPTHSGVGAYQEIDDPYNFSTKAIVVAVDPSSSYKVNDIVILQETLMMLPLGKGNNVSVTLPGGFIHPESNLTDMPTDPLSEHFGYTFKKDIDIISKDGCFTD